MIIGVPKEIKNKENRVGMTPEGVGALAAAGHEVLVEKSAGLNSGFKDSEYKKAGARIFAEPKKIYQKAELIVKIKEPLKTEFQYIRDGQTIFTYLHLAACPDLTKFLLRKNVTGIAYETIEDKDKKLPLLEPMSQVAGKMAVQVGAHFLEKTHEGRGVLLGGTDTVKPAKVLIIGAGIAGMNAAKVARGFGAEVVILDIDDKKIKSINSQKDQLLKAKKSSRAIIVHEIKDADLVIGAVLIPGAKAPKLVTKKMIKAMKPGSVVVDIAIDQGGCFETSKPTTHENPVFSVSGVVHYCVTNMPGAVAHTSTQAITKVTLPYILKMADLGVKKALSHDQSLFTGLNTYRGKLTNKPVAEALEIKFDPVLPADLISAK